MRVPLLFLSIVLCFLCNAQNEPAKQSVTSNASSNAFRKGVWRLPVTEYINWGHKNYEQANIDLGSENDFRARIEADYF